ncbi:hypothetical protein SK128_005263 [Halocaridina rubra]|uniref:Sulfotransferase n=1 Tax=Halocaridina rubra TaxID=373956 RepID=A0AAN9A6R5_HALRR
MSLTSPICYNRHMYFFNSIGNDNGKIAWINLIRDPVERIISQFYYLRVYNKDREKQVLRWGIDPKLWFKMDLNECVKKGDPLCRYKAGDYQELQLSYFCGHMKMCREVGNQYALQQAKYNVEKHYSVVGIMENMNLFFKILQHYLPRFFKDISEVGKIKLNKHLGKSKSKVSNETKIILRNRLSEDYELYEFIQQRLQLQAKRIDDVMI